MILECINVSQFRPVQPHLHCAMAG